MRVEPDQSVVKPKRTEDILDNLREFALRQPTLWCSLEIATELPTTYSLKSIRTMVSRYGKMHPDVEIRVNKERVYMRTSVQP